MARPSFSSGDLSARIRAGDERAFESLYRTYLDGLVTFAVSYVHSQSVAQDLVADLFLKLWTERAAFPAPAHIKSYLYGAIRNRALNYLRDHGRETTLDALDDEPAESYVQAADAEQTLETADRTRLLQSLIAALPDGQRRILTLRWHAELSIDEIAQILGVSRNAVDKQISRAMEKLRRAAPDLLR